MPKAGDAIQALGVGTSKMRHSMAPREGFGANAGGASSLSPTRAEATDMSANVMKNYKDYKEIIRQEMKQLGSDIRKDISILMNDASVSLRNDVRRDIQKSSQPYGKVSIQDSNMNGDHGLRGTAAATLEPSLGLGAKLGGAPASSPTGNARKKPFVKECFLEDHSELAISSDMKEESSFAQRPHVIEMVDHPGEEPPLLPTAIHAIDAEALLVNGKGNTIGGLNATPGAIARLSLAPGMGDGSFSYASDRSSTGSHGWEAHVSLTGCSKIAISNSELASFQPHHRLSLGREQAKFATQRKKKVSPTYRGMTVAQFIQTPLFDNIVGSVILLNAAVIGFQTDHNARELSDKVPTVFFVFEQFFAIWFTGELGLRLWVFRCKFFKPCAEGWLWNYFDFMVVTAQLLEVFFDLVARSMTDSVNADSFRVLRILRILRLVRILRVVRVLHLISELRAIVSSIIGSFRSLIWVVVLLLLMIYIVAVFFTQSITDYLVQRMEDDVNFKLDKDDSDLRYYFQSLGRGVLSLWQAMSGGLDWDAMAGPLFKKISFLTGFAFAAFVAFSLLALMNVVTGVFVQTALLSAKDEEDSFMISQIVALFKVADKDGSTTISWAEITESLEDPLLAKEWKSIGVEAEDARYLFKLLDLENVGEVSFEEFMGGALRLSGGAKAFDLLTVMQETRSSEAKHSRLLLQILQATSDIHEAIGSSRDDLKRLISENHSLVLNDTCNIAEDISTLADKLGAEFTLVKSSMHPLAMIEDLFRTDASRLV